MRRIGGNIDGKSALCGRRADSSAFEYTRRAAELQAFRGNFFAETGSENAPKQKRTAKANPAARSRLASASTRLTNDAVRFSTFFLVFAFRLDAGRPAST